MEPALLAKYYTDALGFLQTLIAIPSFSKEEDKTADAIGLFLQAQGIDTMRKGNNVWATNKYFDTNKPTILLNSHHDTVKPNASYTRNSFKPVIENGKLYGLGSNDAGGALVALAATFFHFDNIKNLPFNLIYAATAEEEISGKGGIESILAELGEIHLAIVGEPTLMKIAVAERGLLVIDCTAEGVAGHAARNEGENAIYKAMKDIEWFRTFQFEKASEWLGPVSMNATIIQAGTTHNTVPAECKFTVDIRLNECYTHQAVLEIIRKNITSKVAERSTRIKPSFIDIDHPFVGIAKNMNIELYGSPTTSDQALLTCPSIKLGPGDSARSHTADEFIYVQEIENGIATYIQLLATYANQLKA